MTDRACCEHCLPTTEAVADLRVQVAEVATDVKHVVGAVDWLKGTLITRAEFRPVRAVAYGVVGAVLLGVLGWAGAALLRVPR